MAHAKLQEAIIAAGYEPLIIVGFGNRASGEFSLKVGAHPAIRTVRDDTWQLIKDTMNRALDNLRESPLDDLENIFREDV